jgi:hypothetical protein
MSTPTLRSRAFRLPLLLASILLIGQRCDFTIPSPDLALSVLELDFGVNENQKELLIFNIGDGDMDWWMVPTHPWITVDPDSGRNDAAVTVGIIRDDMLEGLNFGDVSVSSFGGFENVGVTALHGPTRNYSMRDYWPLALGNSWTWTAPGWSVTATVTEIFDVNGFEVFRLRWEYEGLAGNDRFLVYADGVLYEVQSEVDLDTLPVVTTRFKPFELETMTTGVETDHPFYDNPTFYTRGPFSEFLPYNSPYQGELTIDDFGLGDNEDTMATYVSTPFGVSNFYIGNMYLRDIGPALIFRIPANSDMALQSATINGKTLTFGLE